MENWSKYELKFRYMMLDRLRQDCKYYLRIKAGSPCVLWGNDERHHIETMKAIWNTFREWETPEWLTWEDILEFERKMCTDAKDTPPIMTEE